MAIEFEVQRSTRRCAATDRPLAPGEQCFSVLRRESGEVRRVDYSRDAWRAERLESLTADAIGWWKSRVPSGSSGPKLAPTDVLLRLFDDWADDPHRQDARYVLALLLVRRRVFRMVDTPVGLGDLDESHEPSPDPEPLLRVECPTRGESYELPVAPPGPERVKAIQAQLHELLDTDTP
ncbi:MAG: hypothetical protein AAGJ46_20295 [Planctomycetota bacterium]